MLSPICFDSWTLHSRFLCNIALYSIRCYFHHQSDPLLGVGFSLALSLHSFWSYFSTDLRSILGTYRPMEFIFQCPIFLSFHTFVGVLKARILGLPFPSPVDHILSDLSTMYTFFFSPLLLSIFMNRLFAFYLVCS